MQRTADDASYGDIDEKIAHVRQEVRATHAGILIGGTFSVAACQVLGRRPEAPPDERTLFQQGMMFSGELEAFQYAFSPDVPIDALTLRFINPQVFGVEDSVEHERFARLKLQVPVLAIEAFLLS